MSQSVRVNGVWTQRLGDEAVAAWVARIPANSSAPEECDLQDTWISGGAEIKLCTRCGDLGEEACAEWHTTTLEQLKQHFPEDP